jgi:hypothetical protein
MAGSQTGLDWQLGVDDAQFALYRDIALRVSPLPLSAHLSPSR